MSALVEADERRRPRSRPRPVAREPPQHGVVVGAPQHDAIDQAVGEPPQTAETISAVVIHMTTNNAMARGSQTPAGSCHRSSGTITPENSASDTPMSSSSAIAFLRNRSASAKR